MSERPESNQELIARAAAGEQEALHALLVRELPALEAYVRLRAGPALRARESCADLVQSVCVEVLADLPRFEYRGETRFRHWLCKQALHKIMNKRRFYGAARRDIAREAAPGSGGARTVLDCYRTLCTPSRIASAKEAVAEFEQAFDQLPEDQRQAIALRRIVGLDYGDIAAEMGRSGGAARNLVYRGLARLSALLGD